MKRIYIAAPFFNPQQLSTVMQIEEVIDQYKNLTYYSPRMDGVLQDMPPEQRAASLQTVFQMNVAQIKKCDAMIAILDEKDTGTTWELGMAYGIGKQIFGYTSNPETKLNVMLRQCMLTHASGPHELLLLLDAFSKDKVWSMAQVGDTY
jgi:nucleoside 2-deoxyribosyltransferase